MYLQIKVPENDPDTIIIENHEAGGKIWLINKKTHPELHLAITIAVIQENPNHFIKDTTNAKV